MTKKTRRDKEVGPEVSGALARFWAGGSGPSHAIIGSAIASAGYFEPGEDAAKSKQQRVQLALRKATPEVARRLVEELLSTLRDAGHLDACDGSMVVSLRTAFARRGCNLTDQGFVDWAESLAQTPTRAKRLATVAPESAATEVVEADVRLLLSVFRRLPFAMRPLIERRQGRRGLTIRDEYDTQDAMEAVLRALIVDVRPEERTPSYAGSSSTMDFLLKAQRVAVEAKVTRLGRNEKKIKEELLIDINDYQHHPSVKVLIAVVYDLAATFKNPAGFENDFTRRHSGLEVYVLIAGGWPTPRTTRTVTSREKPFL